MRLVAFFSVCTVPLAFASAQRLVLPDNHNFMESPTYANSAGDNNQWATTARRFQILYEASHFTGKAAIQPGGVVITHVRFRGEDGETNLGGQVYNNVVVQLGSTSLNATTMSNTFGSPTGGGPGTVGSNRDPALTTLGPSGTVATLTVAPSVGSCPNNYCIEIDLVAAGAAFAFDPHGPRPNLLIDITVPTAPTTVVPQFLLPIQDTIAHGAGIRGRSVYSATVTATSGTADTTPPVVGIEFVGGGGWPTEMPARAEYIGAACGGQHATIYQAFTQDQPFDLQNGITLVPDVYPSPNVYTAVASAPPIDLSQLNAVPNTTALDVLVTHPLGFLVRPFQYPGGSTTTIKPCTNGYIWLDAAMTAAQFDPSRANMLGTTTNYTARLMPFWTDQHPNRNTGGNPLTGLHVKTVPESAPGAGDAVCYVTWNRMGAWRTGTGTATVYDHAVWTYQCVLHEATGVVEFRYGAMMPYISTLWTATMENAALVGFTRGRIGGTTPSLDPGSRDLSNELPFTTSVEGTVSNVLLTGVATPVAGSALQTGRMFGGQSLTWNVANIPAGTTVAFLNLDLGASQPGIQLPPAFGILAPNCMMSTSLNPVVLGWESWLFPAGNVVGVTPLNVPHGWEGVVISAQAIGLDLAPGAPFLINWTSNTIKYTVGLD